MYRLESSTHKTFRMGYSKCGTNSTMVCDCGKLYSSNSERTTFKMLMLHNKAEHKKIIRPSDMNFTPSESLTLEYNVNNPKTRYSNQNNTVINQNLIQQNELFTSKSFGLTACC